MARRRTPEEQNEQRDNEQTALEEALTATHQHTLPVLPAFGQDAEDTADSPVRPAASGYRARVPARQTPARSGRHPVQRPRATDGNPPAQDRDVPSPPSTRPTITLPAITNAELAIIPVSDAVRDVARTSADEPTAILIRGTNRPVKPFRTIIPRRNGPPSFYAQFFVAMVTVMLFSSMLTFATPLGHTVGFSTTFEAYANAVPWVPTPTPTPPPTPTPRPVYVAPVYANPGTQAVINEIVAVFGNYAQGAINVARCESGFDPNARNSYPIGNSHAEGVFQILYPSTWVTTSYAAQSPYDYNANIHAAWQIFSRDGYTWREWACQP